MGFIVVGAVGVKNQRVHNAQMIVAADKTNCLARVFRVSRRKTAILL